MNIHGFGRVGRRPEELLLLCFYDPAGISTVPETVASMQSQSDFSFTVLNLFEHRQDSGFLKLSPCIDLRRYVGVVIHNSISYNVDNLQSLDVLLPIKLRDYEGVKILMKQDENFRVREMAQCIGRIGFDLIFTCLPEGAISRVYPAEVVGRPRFERMLTGYVTPTLRAMNPHLDSRPIDIGYRGSIQPLSFGRLAYEKRRIGEDVKQRLQGRELTLDISSRWEDRFGGNSWFDFLGSCKATLGAESGASIFDLDGRLDARCKAIETRLGPFNEDHEYAEAFLAELSDLENNVNYGQISPRHFEAIAMGTVQLLYPGEYSNLLVEQRHYFPIKRDYSNLEAAIDLISDRQRRREMAAAAFEEIILDRKNWIEAFVTRLDENIGGLLEAKGLTVKLSVKSQLGYNVLLLAAHAPKIDPRLEWIVAGAREGIRVHQLCVLPPQNSTPTLNIATDGCLTMASPRKAWTRGTCSRLFAQVGLSPSGMTGVQELLFIEYALTIPESEFCELFGAPVNCARNSQFRWYLRYLLDTAASLLEGALQMRGLHALIATDLDTLPAALIIKGILGVPLMYDAHEYWPEADLMSFEYEKQFWVGLERRMVGHADYCQTVSPGLAALMAGQYGVNFEVVPNCVPSDNLLPTMPPHNRADAACHFLFLGGFAVGRGIDILIRTWPKTSNKAVLILQGPDNSYQQEMKKLAVKTGLLGTRIIFQNAVDESQLVAVAAKADVGLIPYTATGKTYKYCSPNKLSQYMAAGLPILANATSFVAQTIHDARCGHVIDFSRQEQLLQAITLLCENPSLRTKLGNAGRDYFISHFNWGVVSQPLYRQLEKTVDGKQRESLILFKGGYQPYLRTPSWAEITRSRLSDLLRRLWWSVPNVIKRPLTPVVVRIRSLLSL